jgi:hypothetical protein
MSGIQDKGIKMSLQLESGVTGKIEVQNSKGISIYEEPCFSIDEVVDFVKINGKSKPGWSVLQGAVCVLRTNNAKDFAVDFFLPTFVNYTLKINNVALKIFASIFAIVLDVITFPIRLVITPFRAIYNYRNPEEKHPLSSLIERGNKDVLNKENFVTICYEVVDVKINEPTDESAEDLYRARKELIKGSRRVVLKTLPGGIKTQVTGRIEKSIYISQDGDGDWVQENYSESEYAFSERSF